MKNLLFLIILIVSFSCLHDSIIVNPNSIQESKARGAFIKEFIGDEQIIEIDSNKYLIKEVYLTYMVDSKKVHKQVSSLVFKTIDLKNRKFDYPDDYTKFEIIVDRTNFEIGVRSGNLVSDIPFNTSSFKLIYNDNGIKSISNFKEK
jgi:hypothetical protein